MTYSGDDFYDDDVTSGVLAVRGKSGPVLEPCAINGCPRPALEEPFRWSDRTFVILCQVHADQMAAERAER